MGDENKSATLSSSSATTTAAVSSSPSRQLSVVDVYDLAAAVGQDFEQLIAEHGSDNYRQLMPKVISALEMLEAFAGVNDRENEHILQLQKQIERLQEAKAAAAAGRDRYESELETQDEMHRAEMEKMMAVVKQLKLENRQMHERLNDAADADVGYATGVSDEENPMMIRLQQQVHAHKEQVIQLQSDVLALNKLNEKVGTLVNQLSSMCCS